MKLKIGSKEYEKIDILHSINIVNTSTGPRHKLYNPNTNDYSNGERKIYVRGNQEETQKFFDYFTTPSTGFVAKDNLLKFLADAKDEYYHPTQDYKYKTEMHIEHEQFVKQLSDKDTHFDFVFDKSEVTHTGIYINQMSGNKSDPNWNLITDIALPNQTILEIIKLKEIPTERISYYFKMIYKNQDREIELENKTIDEISSSPISETEKELLIKARIGQGQFRTALLNSLERCPFTLISDEYMLIASHIKPWKVATNEEKIDPFNGLLLTPTYDKLFDKGYISFKDNKALMVSDYVSEAVRKQLSLVDGEIIENLPSLSGKRRKYMKYHRDHVFKKLKEI